MPLALPKSQPLGSYGTGKSTGSNLSQRRQFEKLNLFESLAMTIIMNSQLTFKVHS